MRREQNALNVEEGCFPAKDRERGAESWDVTQGRKGRWVVSDTERTFCTEQQTVTPAGV